MSPAKALADCSRIVGAPDFQPKRPNIGACSKDQTICARPEMPSPSASSGSARAKISAAGIAPAGPNRSSAGRCGPSTPSPRAIPTSSAQEPAAQAGGRPSRERPPPLLRAPVGPAGCPATPKSQLPAIDRIGPRARGGIAHRKRERLDLAHCLFGGVGTEMRRNIDTASSSGPSGGGHARLSGGSAGKSAR